jgi:putative membrane protein
MLYPTFTLPAAVISLLHPVAQIGWARWSIHWSTVIGLALFGGAYLWWAGRAGSRASASDPRKSEGTAPRRLLPHQKLSFFAGLIVIFVSLNGPLHDLSDYYLFSAHMVQHLLLTLAVPPLLLVGAPGWLLRPLIADARVAAVARWATRPTRCFAFFNVVVAVWHLPPMYNTAMEYHAVHIVQHITFLVVSVLMWWPFLSPLPELPRLAYPGQMLYCFLMAIPMSIVAIYIAMADHILYPAYSIAPRLWGITPMMDQQIGGLIMWIPGGLFFYAVMSVVFFKWAGKDTDTTAGAQVDWRPIRGTRVAPR